LEFDTSLRQARHPLKLQHEAQRYNHIVHIAVFGRLRKLPGNVTPSITFAEFGRQARVCRRASSKSSRLGFSAAVVTAATNSGGPRERTLLNSGTTDIPVAPINVRFWE
jgi:hypothetical protein